MRQDRSKERALTAMDYKKYDFKSSTKDYEVIFNKGLNEGVVREISKIKKEPKWMLDYRLNALEVFNKLQMPKWGADLSKINFDEIIYYMKPGSKNNKDWADVPDDIKQTFEKLGIPEAERKFLGGVETQFDSEVVYHSIREDLEKQGVIFLGMDQGLKEHEDIVREHFGTVIPTMDNKFAALNSAVWSGGSFLYVPKNVKVEMPLQAYFRINAQNMGQFERTLIIGDKNSRVTYVEGCFTAGTEIKTEKGIKPIEKIEKNDKVLTHEGGFKDVYFTQIRPYSGTLYEISVYGDTSTTIQTTKEHPFYCVKRKLPNERNKEWKDEWIEAKDLKKGDYLAQPINKKIISNKHHEFEILARNNSRHLMKEKVKIKADNNFFKLAGYFLSEGSTDRGFYTSISFGSHEKNYIKETKNLFGEVFNMQKSYESHHKQNHGTSIVVSSAKITRVFEQFGKGSKNKEIPEWMMIESPEKQAELIKAVFYGDGNYSNKKYSWGTKELFRINTISKKLAKQIREILLRLKIASSLNLQKRKAPRKTMYAIVISGEYLKNFGDLVGIKIKTKMNNKKRATRYHIDEDYMYAPIKKIEKTLVQDLPVYNFGVKEDESYTANGIAVHNCTAPIYTTDSLHAAVVEVIAKEDAHVRYTTIQNWSNNIYNLVTKRAHAHKNSIVEWIDGNLGSKITMKYPSIYLIGEGSKAEILSVALAAKGQHLDAGAKVVHLASNTTSTITNKSISKDGGRSSYRGLLKVAKGCKNVKSKVVCDALLLDKDSRSDTYPTIEIDEPTATIAHEARVGKIGTEQIFYLMSRGLSEEEALTLIVMGFISPFTKSLPMEYAIELNRLIEMQMEGCVG